MDGRIKEDNSKRKKKLLIISIIFTLIIFMGSAYAFFTYYRNAQAFTLTSNSIEVEFTEGSNELSFANAYPISDEFAIDNLSKLDYIDFTVYGNVSNSSEAITYEIFLTEDVNNSLDSNYIRTFVTDIEGNEITEPATYGSLPATTYVNEPTGKVVLERTYSGEFTKSYRLYVWLDKNYEQNAVSQTSTFFVNIYAYNSVASENAAVTLTKSIDTLKENNPSCNYVVEDYKNEELEATYLSGAKTGDCAIDFNYLWYSGKMWRITAIYPDGVMKLVTDNNISSIAFNETGNPSFYKVENETIKKSYMYQWLNEDFYNTLYHASEFIETTRNWNATKSTSITTKPLETTLVSAKVGLLNSYEYWMSYKNLGEYNNSNAYGDGYLNMEYNWWLINSYNSSNVWRVSYTGEANYNVSTLTRGARPSIYLKSSVSLTGSGSKTDPYKVVGDKSAGITNELINTRLSGEYIKLSNNNQEQVFRIVGIEDKKTKIVAMDYADNRATRKFATTEGVANTLWGSGASVDDAEQTTWYSYLNKTYYPNLVATYGELFDSGTYYLGTTGFYYKLGVCNTTGYTIAECLKNKNNSRVTDILPDSNNSSPVYIGLLRYGEMLATQQGTGYENSIHMWLINRYTTSQIWRVYNYGIANDNSPIETYGARPTVHLKSTVKILSGSGTELDPYVVGL